MDDEQEAFSNSCEWKKCDKRGERERSRLIDLDLVKQEEVARAMIILLEISINHKLQKEEI